MNTRKHCFLLSLTQFPLQAVWFAQGLQMQMQEQGEFHHFSWESFRNSLSVQNALHHSAHGVWLVPHTFILVFLQTWPRLFHSFLWCKTLINQKHSKSKKHERLVGTSPMVSFLKIQLFGCIYEHLPVSLLESTSHCSQGFSKNTHSPVSWSPLALISWCVWTCGKLRWPLSFW